MARILVIDDNSTFRWLLRLQLERAGHEVVEAANGAEGIQLYHDRPIDLVLCDLFMPEKEGLETIRELRRAGETRIIAMTGDAPVAPSPLLQVAERFGAAQVLSKPFDGETLLHTVREVLADGKGRTR
jgi:CheY-like chemotaxis protein